MLDPALAKRLATAARKGREWTERRDELIVAALSAGASQREVAKVAGLSQPTIHAIWHRDHKVAEPADTV
jgi:DNA invertase Pin-like site-specific DNA recombinase